MITEPKSRFLTIAQVADELNVGSPQNRGMLKTGELRGIQIGGKGLWRIGKVDLEGYIQEAYAKAAGSQDKPESDGDGLGPQ